MGSEVVSGQVLGVMIPDEIAYGTHSDTLVEGHRVLALHIESTDNTVQVCKRRIQSMTAK